jgi:hypothetical protein
MSEREREGYVNYDKSTPKVGSKFVPKSPKTVHSNAESHRSKLFNTSCGTSNHMDRSFVE